MKVGKLVRAIGASELQIDVEKRTVTLPFSSEFAVDRWFGKEILSHAPTAVDMSRVQLGACPLLFNHDPDDLIGVVSDVEVRGDMRAYTTVRFSEEEEADKRFKQVQEGVLRNISFGYLIEEMALTKTGGAGDEYTATRWQIYEISFVSIPADPTVGMGRSSEGLEFETRIIKPVEHPKGGKKSMDPIEIKIDVNQEREAARAEERKRIAAISAIGEKFGQTELARQFVDNGGSFDAAREAILEKVEARQKKPVTQTEAIIGMNEKEVREFSFLRAINALANPADRKAQEAAAFEFECSRAAEKAGGKSSRGVLVPFDVLRDSKRDMTVGSSTAGGNLVATNLLGASFVELLRNKMVLDRAGVTILNGLMGNIAIPRATGSAAAYHVGENTAPTESAPAFDQVTMSPKTVGAYVDFSRRLAIQSSVQVEQFVKGDLATVLALAIDSKGLYGTGSSNQPTGVQNVAGINTKDFAADAPTFAEIIAMETEVASDNADVGTLAYLINARGRGVLKGTTKTSPSTEMIWEPGNTVNGYRTEVSNQISLVSSGKEHYWFGNWADLIIGFWSGLDLMVDPYTGSKEGTIRVVALQDYDVAVRHPESFCLGANLT